MADFTIYAVIFSKIARGHEVGTGTPLQVRGRQKTQYCPRNRMIWIPPALSGAPPFSASARRHSEGLCVLRSINSNKPTDHGLIGSMVLPRLFLEEIYAEFTQGHGDLDIVFLKNEILGRWKKINYTGCNHLLRRQGDHPSSARTGPSSISIADTRESRSRRSRDMPTLLWYD